MQYNYILSTLSIIGSITCTINTLEVEQALRKNSSNKAIEATKIICTKPIVSYILALFQVLNRHFLTNTPRVVNVFILFLLY